MNILLKRRQIITATLVVALAGAVFVNWYYTSSRKPVKEEETKPDAQYVQNLGEARSVNSASASTTDFTKLKLDRDKKQDEALEKLNESLKNAKSGSDESAEITKSIKSISANIKLQNDMETLIMTKLGSECLVVFNGKSAEVIIAKGKLNDDSVLQITDAIMNNTEIKADNIKITEA